VIAAPMISIRGSEFRRKERVEIHKFNRGLLEQSKNGAASGHAHHDCNALGCFSSKPSDQIERMVDRVEAERKPYMIQADKKSRDPSD